MTWFFRGVPAESSEVLDVDSTGEITPARPDRLGARWRQFHSAGFTETAYTSWTTVRSMAVAAAEWAASGSDLSGRAFVFRVRADSIEGERIFPGRDDENEYLIEGTVEGVEVSLGDQDEEE